MMLMRKKASKIRFSPLSHALAYKKCFMQVHDILIIMKEDGQILEANQAAAKAYHYSLEELCKLNMNQLRPYKSQSQFVQELKQSSGEGILFRTRHRRRNQEEFPVEVSSRFIRNDGEKIIISIIRDITETVKLEDALRASEENYRQLNEETTALNEELTASEEELRQQLDELLTRDREIREQNLVLTLVHQTALSLMNRLDINELLGEIVKKATDLLHTPHAYICLIDEKENAFIPVVATGEYVHVKNQAIPLTFGLTGQVFRSGQTMIVEDYHASQIRLPGSHFFQAPLYCTIQVPFTSEGKVTGTLGLSLDDPARMFLPEEINLLNHFAELASIGLDNASLFTSYKNELQARRLKEKELQQLQADNQALLNAIPDIMLRIGSDGTFLDCKDNNKNPYLPPEQLLGKKIPDIFPPELAETALSAIHSALETGSLQQFEYQLPVHKQLQYFEARIMPIGTTESVAILRNITDRKQSEEHLLYLSHHDTMTGLYNRDFFEEVLRQIDEQQITDVGIIMCDLDGVKLVNDTLGHSMGDTLLKSTALLLRQIFEPANLVARVGGDEFAVVIYSNSEADFKSFYKKIQQKIRRYNSSHPKVPLSLSIGCAVNKQNPLNIYELFKEADNNMYREKLLKEQSSKNAIIQGLISALEARDFITEGHSSRLESLIFSMATAVGLPEKSLPDLRLFARFHDLGKVGIPDKILLKPDRLTPEEFAVMKQHSEIGYRIAKSVPDLLPIADWILKHHEWWNGKGYPFALKGEDIPIECRILAIADAYDAMTNDRPYRQAMDKEQALNELKRCAGTQFDIKLVHIFIDLYKLN